MITTRARTHSVAASALGPRWACVSSAVAAGTYGSWRAGRTPGSASSPATRGRHRVRDGRGLGAGQWDPVHEFCDAAQRLPLSPRGGTSCGRNGLYPLYLSRGVLSADIIAEHLAQEGARKRVIQGAARGR